MESSKNKMEENPVCKIPLKKDCYLAPLPPKSAPVHGFCGQILTPESVLIFRFLFLQNLPVTRIVDALMDNKSNPVR